MFHGGSSFRRDGSLRFYVFQLFFSTIWIKFIIYDVCVFIVPGFHFIITINFIIFHIYFGNLGVITLYRLINEVPFSPVLGKYEHCNTSHNRRVQLESNYCWLDSVLRGIMSNRWWILCWCYWSCMVELEKTNGLATKRRVSGMDTIEVISIIKIKVDIFKN